MNDVKIADLQPLRRKWEESTGRDGPSEWTSRVDEEDSNASKYVPVKKRLLKPLLNVDPKSHRIFNLEHKYDEKTEEDKMEALKNKLK
jgi:hypothetical protein